MKKGEHWEVHFSRGALRRRKSVSDARTPSRTRHCVRDAMPGFDSVIAVDEVDRHRRKSQDVDMLTAFTLEVPSACLNADASVDTDDIPLRRALSLPDAVYPGHMRLLPDLHPHPLSPPIQEEDEFRPSPRRTPIPSPFGSSTNLRALHAAAAEKAAPRAAAVAAGMEPVAHAHAGPSTPPPATDTEDAWYFVPLHARVLTDPTNTSPYSTPSSSPVIDHARPSGRDSPTGTRKRPLMQLPGSIFRASTSVLKGISGMGGGMPMSV